jgi:hypothetical protein
VDAAVCGTKCIWRVRRCRAPRTDCVDRQGQSSSDQHIAATGYDIQHAIESCKQRPGLKNQWTYNPFPALAKHAKGTAPGRSEKLGDSLENADNVPPHSEAAQTIQPSASSASTPNTENAVQGLQRAKDLSETWMFEPVSTPFSNLNANALAIFQELSTAVVAGMHMLMSLRSQLSLRR